MPGGSTSGAADASTAAAASGGTAANQPSYDVIVRLDRSDARLRPGMTITATLEATAADG
jgi:hypothetical protein